MAIKIPYFITSLPMLSKGIYATSFDVCMNELGKEAHYNIDVRTFTYRG